MIVLPGHNTGIPSVSLVPLGSPRGQVGGGNVTSISSITGSTGLSDNDLVKGDTLSGNLHNGSTSEVSVGSIEKNIE